MSMPLLCETKTKKMKIMMKQKRQTDYIHFIVTSVEQARQFCSFRTLVGRNVDSKSQRTLFKTLEKFGEHEFVSI